MFAIVSTFPQDELVIITRELQCSGHVLVRQRPVAKLIVEIVAAVLQEDFERLFVGLTNEGRIDVTATDVGE